MRPNPLRDIWSSMLRCCSRLPAHADFKHYGGRGITVSPRWHVFESFKRDILATIGPFPGKGWSIDRRNNNSGYRRGNVRWATYTTQNRNRSLSSRSGKLTVGQVAAIRNSYVGDARAQRGSITQQQLADLHGVSRPMISRVLGGHTWK